MFRLSRSRAPPLRFDLGALGQLWIAAPCCTLSRLKLRVRCFVQDRRVPQLPAGQGIQAEPGECAEMYRALQLLYLMLPVYAANMAAAFVKFWPGPNRPICARCLGEHKTWMGVVFAVLAATVVAGAQAFGRWSGSLLDPADWWLLGPVCGLAAMLGDSLKSLVKRRIGIPPGQPWKPADQLDFVLAGLLALSCWVDLDWTDAALVMAFTLVAAVFVNRLAYVLGVKDVPW